MKNLLVSILILMSTSAFAETMVSGGFGTDGATLESSPTQQSVKQAANVYNALNVPVSDSEKSLEAEDGMFECKQPEAGLHTATASCGFLAFGRVVADGIAEIGPKISAKIYEALNVTEVVRMGASTKAVDNISCSKIIVQEPIFKCTIRDVVALQL